MTPRRPTRFWQPFFAASAVAAVLLLAHAPSAQAQQVAAGTISPTTLKLPDGPGSVAGLTDGASAQLFSGQVQYAVPFDLPAAGGLGPAVLLEYAGGTGNSSVGVGWSLAVPAIRRSLRQGVPTLLAQIDWRNGQHTEAALLQMRHVEDYLKLKNYRPLQAVPAEFWSVSDEIELAIPQKNNMSGSVSPKKMEEEITAKTQLKNTVWRQRLIIALLALVVIALLWRKIFG
mgnify:CR=1 FL=1